MSLKLQKKKKALTVLSNVVMKNICILKLLYAYEVADNYVNAMRNQAFRDKTQILNLRKKNTVIYISI